MSWVEQNLISHSLIVNSDDCDSGMKMGENNQYLYLNCEML